MPGDDTSSSVAARDHVVHIEHIAQPAAHGGQLVERHAPLVAIEVEAQDIAPPFAPIVDVDDLHALIRDERLGNLAKPAPPPNCPF